MNEKVPILLLVAANLLPVAGVLVWGWDVFSILFLFWCENVVIGVFGIVRTAVFSMRINKIGGLFTAAFFSVHYGGFMFGHVMVLMGLFLVRTDRSKDSLSDFQYVLSDFDRWTWVTIAALLVSHAWSFVQNFLGKREYESLTTLGAMAMPYKRMMITHVALIVGGFLLTALDQPLAGLLLLLGMKIALDVVFHRREHKELA